ncbi:hypothetical protein FISHEDRAFT_8819, partial [Fistulina hepatica ATCC 64428]
KIELNWHTLQDVIAAYFMNRRWLDDQKHKANRASYQQSAHTHETPSEYFIRKSNLLKMVWNLKDTEIISEVMRCVPPEWATILTEQLYEGVVEF